MKRIKFLNERIGDLQAEMSLISELCDDEARARNEAETKRWDEIKGELKNLEGELADLRELEEAKEKRAAKKAASIADAAPSQSEKKEQDTHKEAYSFSNAFDALLNQKPVEGREAEIHQEAVKECRDAQANISVTGVGVPSWMLEKRTDVDQATSAIQGTVVEGYVDAIRESSVYERLVPASNIMTGLTSDVKLVNVDKQSLAWATAENSAAADGGANLGKDTLAPVRLTGYVDVSNRVTMQNGDAVIRALMADLGRETANKIDASIFATADVSDAPPSIGGTSGVLTFTEAAAYAAASSTAYGSVYSDVLAAIQKLADGNALQGALGFAGSSKLLSDLHKSSRILSVMPAMENFRPGGPVQYSIEGIPFVLTTACTSNGTTSADFLGGDFSKFFIGFFGGMDMVLDPWSVALNDQRRIIVHRHLDTSLLMGEGMVKATSLLS